MPPYGLNVALIDPFGIRGLKFETIRKLAAFSHMDLIIKFPVQDIRRNHQHQTDAITAAVGTDRWVGKVRLPEEAPRLMEFLREELSPFQYVDTFAKNALVTQSTNVPLYYLMYFTKHEKGVAIWNSIMQIDAKGQRRLDF